MDETTQPNPQSLKLPEHHFYEWKWDSWPGIVACVIVWASTYQLARLCLPEKSPEYSCRITSFLHGFLSAFVGINQCFIMDSPFQHPEWRTTTTQSFLIAFSLGYFVHDLAWCLIYQRESKLMIAHHIYSVIALNRMLFKGSSGAQVTCSLGSMELTNPILQIRWFLRSEGFYPSLLFSAVELTFMVIFFTVRILVGTWFLYVITFEPKNDWEFRFLALTIYVMSCMFMLNILKYFFIKYAPGFRVRVDEELHHKNT